MSSPIGRVLELVHNGEADLAEQFRTVATRHDTEHEIRHIARDLAGWSVLNSNAVVPVAERYARRSANRPDPPSRA